jgi:hypothetical protein
MFTFATTVTVFGAVASCDNGGDDSAYGCPSVECEEPDSSFDSGGVQPLYGLSGEAGIDEDAAPDASDGSFIDDSGDAGEDAD